MEIYFVNFVFESTLAGALMDSESKRKTSILALVMAVAASILLIPAAEAQDAKVVSLLTAQAFVTQRLLPFSLEKSSGEKLNVLSARVAPPCYSMIDRFRPNIFHVYCLSATSTRVSIAYQDGDQIKEAGVDLNGIRAVALISTTPVGPDPGPNPLIEQGRELFQVKNCASCHPGTPISSQQTAASIEANFADSPSAEMKAYKGQISVSDRDALAAYINEEFF